MEQKFNLRVTPKFVKETLRQSDYTNYTAIADIIDNSIEPDVCSENVFITLEKTDDKKSVSKILISDDGVGMDEETLKMAMALGSETGKSKDYNLGCYGVGLKSAAISIGTHLDVYTKMADDSLRLAILDLNDISEDGEIKVRMLSFDDNSDEMKFFNGKTNSNHGTIVVISDLDQLSNKDYRSFEGTLIRQLRILFNKYINSGVINFFVNGKKLTFFDTIGNEIGLGTEPIDNGIFEHNGCEIEWKAWYLPKNIQDGDFDDYFGRTNKDLGIYVYRHHRLVGRALDFGLCQRSSHWTNGFRFELFMDGNADKLFKTTSSKMVSEKDKSDIDQGLYDKLSNIIKPLVRQCINRQKRERDDSSEKVSEEIKKSLEQTTERLNKNTLLASMVKQKGENKKKNEQKKKNPDPKKQENPNPTKKRHGKWLGGFEFVPDTPCGFMYDIEKRDGKVFVLINENHAFYTEIFSKLNEESRYSIAAFLACETVAKANCGYDRDDEVEKHINLYKDYYADAVYRLFKNN